MDYNTVKLLLLMPIMTAIANWFISKCPLIFKMLMNYWNKPVNIPSVKIKYTLTRGASKSEWDEVFDERHNKYYLHALFDIIKPNDHIHVECKAREATKMVGCNTVQLIPVFYIYGKTKFNDFIIDVVQNNKDDETIKSTEVIISHPLGHEYIKEFLHDIYLEYCKKYYNTVDHNRYFYNKTEKSYEKLTLNNNKSFDDLFFPEKNQIIQMLDKLLKGHLKKLSILLYGKPGCGKSSIIKAISTYTGYSIIEVKLSLMNDDNELKSLFFNPLLKVETGDKIKYIDVPLNKRLFILEDIDADHDVVKTRLQPDSNLTKILEKPSKLTLSGVLNTLDGVLEINGSIIVMTTNHPETLDPALSRPGRVTLNIELKTMKSKDALSLIQKYYPSWSIIIPDQMFTPADLENKCQMSSNEKDLINLLNL